LRDRAGNVLESVEFNGKVYTKQAPQPEPAPLPTGYGIPINLATPPVSVFPTWMKNGW